MRKLEFIIIFQVLLGFNLYYDAGKNDENCQMNSLNLFIVLIPESHVFELRSKIKC